MDRIEFENWLEQFPEEKRIVIRQLARSLKLAIGYTIEEAYEHIFKTIGTPPDKLKIAFDWLFNQPNDKQSAITSVVRGVQKFSGMELRDALITTYELLKSLK